MGKSVNKSIGMILGTSIAPGLGSIVGSSVDKNRAAKRNVEKQSEIQLRAAKEAADAIRSQVSPAERKMAGSDISRQQAARRARNAGIRSTYTSSFAGRGNVLKATLGE